MRPVPKCVFSSLVSAVILLGQSLRVPPSTTHLQMPGVFSITMDSPRSKAPAALQWELSVPPAISIRTADIAIGKTAESAGKSLTCAAKAKTQRRSTIVCVLAGGQELIPNGEIAEVQYRAQWEVKGTPIRVAIENIFGASADLKKITIPNVDAMIEIARGDSTSDVPPH